MTARADGAASGGRRNTPATLSGNCGPRFPVLQQCGFTVTVKLLENPVRPAVPYCGPRGGSAWNCKPMGSYDGLTPTLVSMACAWAICVESEDSRDEISTHTIGWQSARIHKWSSRVSILFDGSMQNAPLNLTWGALCSWCSEGITSWRLPSFQHGNQALQRGTETRQQWVSLLDLV